MDYLALQKNFPALFDNENALLKIITDEKTITAWQAERVVQLAAKNQPADWAEIGIIYSDAYFMVLRDLVQFPDGQLSGYSRVIGQANLRGGRGVVVLPVYQEKILLLHQYRHPTRQWHYEVPRGFGEENTPDADNARKEIEEETGGKISELVSLGLFHNNTGFEAYPVSMFFARLESIGVPNANEGIESFTWLDVETMEKWIADEVITDGFTISAFTKARLKKLI